MKLVEIGRTKHQCCYYKKRASAHANHNNRKQLNVGDRLTFHMQRIDIHVRAIYYTPLMAYLEYWQMDKTIVTDQVDAQVRTADGRARIKLRQTDFPLTCKEGDVIEIQSMKIGEKLRHEMYLIRRKD